MSGEYAKLHYSIKVKSGINGISRIVSFIETVGNYRRKTLNELTDATIDYLDYSNFNDASSIAVASESGTNNIHNILYGKGHLNGEINSERICIGTSSTSNCEITEVHIDIEF